MKLAASLFLGFLSSTTIIAQTISNIQTDNLSKIYYVSPSGDDRLNDGLSLEKPFKSVQKAADLTKPGDTVYLTNGTYVATNSGWLAHIQNSGTPNAWISYKAYPGSSPKLKPLPSGGWHIFFIDAADYINIEGLDFEGNAQNITLDYAKSQAQNGNNPLTNGNCLSIDGRKVTNKPHHIRLYKNKIHDCGGGGTGSVNGDYITIDSNEIYNNAWYSVYGNSGISLYQSYDFDDNTADYKMKIVNNRIYNNRENIPWISAGQITDGNGLIIDDGRNTQNGSTLGAYKGKTLVANNIVYGNGGSGIHVYLSDNVDILNNIAYMNNQTPELDQGQIYTNTGSNVNILNNVMVAFPGKNVNSTYSGNVKISYDFNVYSLSDTLMPKVKGLNDTIADPQFVDPANGNFGLKSTSPVRTRMIQKVIDNLR